MSKEFNLEHNYGSGMNEHGGGVSFVDFNQDGWDDITLASAVNKEIAFFQNVNGTFVKASINLPDQIYESKQVLWIDFDNDGDKDLFITNYNAPDYLYENIGDLIFMNITQDAGLSLDSTKNFGATWVDFDRDGWLDLYVTNRNEDNASESYNIFYRNNGDKTFTDVTEQLHLDDPRKAPFCATFFDYDNDGWEDVYIAQDLSPRNSFFRNDRGKSFQNIAAEVGADLLMTGMCVAVGDVNNDLFLDVYITNTPAGGSKLLINSNGSEFVEAAQEYGVGFFGFGWAANFFDFDNDADLDLYVCGTLRTPEIDNKSNALYENHGASFSQIFEGFDSDTTLSFSSAVGDFNNDGYPDLIVNNHFPHNSQLWLNLGNENNFIKLKLEGTISNRDAIGAKVYVFMDTLKQVRQVHGGTGFLNQNSNDVIVGLGQFSMVDSIEVHWPSGHKEKIYHLEANTTHFILEGFHNKISPQLNIEDGVYDICEGSDLNLNTGYFSNQLKYFWDTGSEESSIDINETGLYKVRVIMKSDSFYLQSNIVINNYPKVNLEADITSVSCFGTNDGAIFLTSPENISDLNLSWSNGKDQAELLHLPANIYSLIIIDQYNCKSFFEFSVDEPDKLIFTIDFDQTALGMNAHVTAQGGTPPYIYFYNEQNMGEMNFVENIEDQIFSLSVLDSNGCRVDKTINREIVSSVNTSIEIKNEISIFPNPISSKLNISSDRFITRVILFDLQGKIILINDTMTMLYQLSTNPLPSGFYMIKIVLDNDTSELQRIFVN